MFTRKSLQTCTRLLTLAVLFFPALAPAHVTLRPAAPLRPGGFATVHLVVPTERHVPTVQVTLEVPQAFLEAGGRLSRVEHPSDWQVTFEKEEKPADVYSKEMEERASRSAGSDNAASAGQTEQEKQDEAAQAEMRRRWIKRVTFSGNSIPPDGFKEFFLNFQLPERPGVFRFSALQTYQDGVEVSWSELVEGADHPAATISITEPPRWNWRDVALGISLVLILVLLVRSFSKSSQRA